MPMSFTLQAKAGLYGNYQFARGHTRDQPQVPVGSQVHRTQKVRERALQDARKVFTASVGAAGASRTTKAASSCNLTPPCP